MPGWMIALAALVSTTSLLLLWRRHVQARAAWEARVSQLEERAGAAEAETRRCAENVHVLQRLLLEKGVADEEDFEAAKRADQLDGLSSQRGVH